MVPRFGLAGFQPAHRDQAEPEVADFGQQPVQRWLVSKQTADDCVLALRADLEAVEPGRQPAVQDTRHADLIPSRPAAGAHSSSSQRPAGAAERAMPGGADCASSKYPRLPCRALTGLGAAIAVLPAGCVSFMQTVGEDARAGRHPKVAWKWNLAVITRLFGDHPGRGWPGSLQAYGACDMSDNLLVAGWPDGDSQP